MLGRRQQALDRVGDREAPRRRGRAGRVHLPGRAHREERPRPRRDRRRARSSPSATCAPTTTSRASSPRWRRPSAAGSTSSSTRSRSRPPRISRAASSTRRATASGWRVDISAYSLVACARAAEPLMEARGGGSIVTMTYLGGERAVPHYNVMGVAKSTLDASRSLPRLGSRLQEHPRERDLGRAGPHARGALDRRLHDDGDDVRGARAAPPPDRGRRLRRRGRVPPLGRGRETSPARRSTSTPATTRWACSTRYRELLEGSAAHGRAHP